MTAGIEIENRLCDCDHALLRVICHPKDRTLFNKVYLCAKFDDFSYSCSRNIIGAPK